MQPERLTRFSKGAPVHVKARFAKELMAALDSLGVEPGEDFYVMPLNFQLDMDFTSAVGADSTDGNELGPFARESDTSRKAAVANFPRSGTQRHTVFEAVYRSRGYGRTREELEIELEMPSNTLHPRVWELLHGGYVEESDETRLTKRGQDAKVLKVTEKGAADYAGEATRCST